MLSEQVRRWIEDSVGGRVISEEVLAGATSSLLHAVEVDRNGARLGLVLRRFVNEEWVKDEPDIASREAASLRHATRAGLPAPELVACDANGAHCGVAATLVVMLPGKVVLQPPNWKQWLQGLAESAAQIHRVDADGFLWVYRRYNERLTLTVPSWSRQPEAWEKAIELVEAKA